MSNTISFDESFYLSRNPDVAAAVSRGVFASGAQHYQLNGRFEGRNPNAFFDTSFYLGQYPDVARAGINPLTHFLNNGAAEGRFANLTEKTLIDLNGNGGADDFNEAAYRTTYSDVDAAIKAGTFKNAYQHFVQFGQFEGRVATLSNGTTVTGPFGNTGAGGSNLSLTTGVDTIVGTNGNDIITADNTGTAATLSAADTINGGAGNDTLRIFLGNSATSVPAAAISNVENISINGGALTSIDATKYSGLTSLTLDSTVQASGSTLAVTTSGQTVALVNSKVASGASGTFTTQLTSTTDTAANVVLNNVTSNAGTDANGATAYTQTLDIAGSKVATVNLTSTGSANTVTLTNSATSKSVTTINITGDKALSLTENLANVKTINASTATGNVTVDTSAGAANVALTFTGGTGNDKIVFASGALTKTTVLDGGAGTDTVVIKDVAISGTSTDLNTAINAVKNFETLGFGSGGTGSVTADLSKITSVSQFSIENALTGTAANAGATFSGESNTQTIILNAGVTGGSAAATSNGQTGLVVTPALDNGSNVANLTLNGVTVAGSDGAAQTGTNANTSGGAAANLGSFETVNIVSNASAAGTGSNAFTGGAAGTGGSGTAGSVGSGLLVGANATINITGSADLNLGSVVSNVGQSANNSITLNAGTFNGKLTVATGAGNDVITVGSNGSSVFAGAGQDKITFGAGVDVALFTSGTTESGTLVNSAVTAIDQISSFRAGAGGDRLAVIGGDNTFTALTAGQQTTVTAATTLTGAADAAANAHGVAGWTAFSFGGNVYALHETGTTTTGGYVAGDQLVQLVGLNAGDLTAANFGQ